MTSIDISGSFTVNTCIIHYRHQEFSHWLNLLPWEQLIHRKAAHKKRQVPKAKLKGFSCWMEINTCVGGTITDVFLGWMSLCSVSTMTLINLIPFAIFSLSPHVCVLVCITHSVLFFHNLTVSCSPLDYLPTLLFLRRFPHLDAPVMITSSVSNVNVSVQLGDTTPFALGFLSANAGTVGL